MSSEYGEASASGRMIQQIFQDTFKKYLTDREDFPGRVEGEGKRLVFVHELCECSYKREMRIKYPEIEKAQTSNARFAVGTLMEEALKARFCDDGDHQHMREVEIDGKICVVSGSIDVIDHETKVPVEVKYQTSLTGVPRDHHILQLRLYLWLSDSSKGELLYVSPQGLKAFGVENPTKKDEVVSLIRDAKIPRWVEWECSYCPYEPFCSKSAPRRRE